MAKRIQTIRLTESDLHNMIKSAVKRVIKENNELSTQGEEMIECDEWSIPLSQAEALALEQVDTLRGTKYNDDPQEIEIEVPGHPSEPLILYVSASYTTYYHPSTARSYYDEPDDYYENGDISVDDAYFVDINDKKIGCTLAFMKKLGAQCEPDPSDDPEDFVYEDDPDYYYDSRNDW